MLLSGQRNTGRAGVDNPDVMSRKDTPDSGSAGRIKDETVGVISADPGSQPATGTSPPIFTDQSKIPASAVMRPPV